MFAMAGLLGLRGNDRRPSGTTPPQALTMLLYTALIAMSSADSETARNFETKQYAHNQGPATASTYDPDHHSLASGSVVWAHQRKIG